MEFQTVRQSFIEWKNMLVFLSDRRIPYLVALFADCIIVGSLPVAFSFALNDMIKAAVDGNIDLLVHSSFLIGLTFLLFSLTVPVVHYWIQRMVKKTMAVIRLKLYEHMLRLNVSYYESNHPGEILSRIINDAQNMEDAYGDGMRRILQNGMTLVMAIATMLFMNWQFSLLFLLLGVGITYINSRFILPLRETNDRIQAKTGEITAKMDGFMDGLSVIKTFSAGKLIRQDLEKTNQELTQTANSQGFKTGILDGINFFFSFVMFGGMLVAGLFLFSKNELGTLGQLVQLQTTMMFIFLEFGRIIAMLQKSLSGSSRVFELLGERIEEKKSIDNSVELPFDNLLEMDALSLHEIVLQRGENTVLNRINFSIRKGEITAIVGASGSGKSTLLKVLLGFYPPTQGEIHFFNKNMNAYTLTQHRELIAYVPQEPHLFEGTIEENIRFGQWDASESDIVIAAQAAFADEFIRELPDGYNTLVGESAVRLSGGQRQRIAIARSLLSKAPIVLLDEPTSALDANSESSIRDTIRLLRGQKAVVLVTHQKQTAEVADTIIVMDQGSIVDSGAPRELEKIDGPYRHLFASESAERYQVKERSC